LRNTVYNGQVPTKVTLGLQLLWLGCLRSRQREISANECDSGTNYLR